MATLLNERQYNGSLYMRNDCIFSGSTSKYKRRKVSAVRDFPPGCDPNVQLAQLRPNGVKVDEQSLATAAFNGLETSAVGIPEETNEAKARKRSISATRNFPPLRRTCDTQELSGVVVRNIEVKHEVIEKLNYDTETGQGQPFLCDMENGSLGETLIASMETNAVDIWEETSEAVACKRRVSAIRDFPPLCGTSAPQELKDKLQNGVSGERGLVEVGSGEIIDTLNFGMETMLLGHSLCDLETDTFGKTSMASMDSIPFEDELEELDADRMEEPENLVSKYSEDMRNFAAKEIVLYPQDAHYKSRPSENVLASVGPVAREIVHGLMAVPYCPWSQRKSAFARSIGGRRKRKVNEDSVAWKKRSTAINEERIPEAVGKELVLYQEEENSKKRPSANVLVTAGPVAREIVCGLVAEPYCPGAVKKSASTSSVGRTSERKVNEDIVVWRKRSKANNEVRVPEAVGKEMVLYSI